MPHIPRQQLSGSPYRGYVYLIRMQGVHKVGKCRSWRARKKGYSGMPFPVTLVCLLRTDDPSKLESDLHARYAPKRLHGEWFNLDAREVAEICAHPLRVDREG